MGNGKPNGRLNGKSKNEQMFEYSNTAFGCQGGEGPPRAAVGEPAASSADLHTKEILNVKSLKTITAKGNRLDKLKAVATILAIQIDACEDRKELPQLVKQYRETIREIEEIEGMADDGDEISEILTEREHNGEPGAVRKNRTKL